MAQADGTILIDTEIDADGMKAGSNEVEAAVRRMAGSLNDLSTKAKTSLSKQVNAFAKLNQEFATQQKKVDDLKNKVAEYSSQKIPTAEYAEIQNQISKATEKMNKLLSAQERFVQMGGKLTSNQYKKYQYDIEELANTIRYAEGELRDLEETGKAFTFGNKTKEAQADMERLAAAERKLSDMNNRLGTSYSSIKGTVNDYQKNLSKSSKSQSKASRTARPLYSVFKNLSNVLNKTTNTLRKYFGNLVKTVSSMSMFRKETDRTRMSLAKMLAMSILFSAVFRAISAVTGGLATGFQNLSLYSERTNQDISMLMSALTQLKNSFATAFAPILTVVAPILTSFINMISQVVTYVGMFWASLFGQDYFIKAVPVQEDYASTLEDTTSNLKDVTEATKEAEKAAEGYLSPIDEINKMQKEINASEIATVPTVGSPAIITPGDIFEKVPINSKIQSFVKKLKDLVNKEDWNGLGKLIASKINGMLQYVYDAINWDNVGPRITKFTYAFTETFNSLVDNIDWDLLGRTVGAGINTLVNTFNQLADGIDWFNIGRSIADGINGLFDEVDWYNLGHLIGNYFRISWDIFGGIVTNLDYSKIGRSVADGLNGVFKTISFSDVAYYLATALNGAFTALESFALTFDWQNLVNNIAGGINRFISTFDWKGNAEKLNLFIQNLLQTLLDIAEKVNWEELGKGIADFISGIDWWTALTKVVKTITTTLGGLFDGLEESGTSSKIAAFLGRVFIAIKIADILGITTLAGNLISAIIANLQSETNLKKMTDAFKTIFSQSAGDASTKVTEELGKVGSSLDEVGEKASKSGGIFSTLKSILTGGGPISGTAGIIGALNTFNISQQEVEKYSDGTYAAITVIKMALDNVAESSGLSTMKLSDMQAQLAGFEYGQEGFQEAFNKIIGKLDDAGVSSDEFKTALSKAIDETGYKSGEFSKVMQEYIGNVSGSFENASSKSENMKETINESTKSINENTLQNMDSVKTSVNDAFENVDDTTVLRWGNSSKEVKLKLRAMKLAASTELANMTKTVRSYSESMYNIFTTKWEYTARDTNKQIESISTKFSKAMNTMKSSAESTISRIGSLFDSLANQLANGSIVTAVYSMSNSLRSSFNQIITYFNQLIYGAQNAWNQMASLLSFDISIPYPLSMYTGYSRMWLNVPFRYANYQIPYLANGAVIPPNKEFLAVLGDQKQGTNIEAPISTIEQAVRNVIGEGGNAQYRIPIYINGRQILEAVVDEGELKRRRSGSNPFALGGA